MNNRFDIPIISTDPDDLKDFSEFHGSYITKSSSAAKIEEKYEILEIIGKGRFGEVRKVKCLQSEELRVMKKIEKKDFTKKVLDEIQLLKRIDHPNIVHLYEVLEDEENFYLVEELCWGGDLLCFIEKNKCITEKVAASFIRQILSALNYCHNLGIIHRDIKAENIAFSSKSPESFIKLLDFGISRRIKTKEFVKEIAGSNKYLAPEVLHKCSSSKCDIWSTGVLLYILLSKRAPFIGKTQEEILKNVALGKFSFSGPPWPSISASCKDFIQKCLTVDQYERPSASECLEHSFFKGKGSSKLISKDSTETEKIIKLLESSPPTEILERAVKCQIAIFQQTKEKLEQDAQTFVALDSDEDGQIGQLDLQRALEQYSLSKNASAEAERILLRLSLTLDRTLKYTDFLGIITKLDEEKLQKAFSYFDCNGDNIIDCDDLLEIFGKNYPDAKIIEILEKFGSVNLTKADFISHFKI